MGAETIKKHMTDAEWQKIYEMSQDRSLYQNLISSLFPTIHGQYTLLGCCGLYTVVYCSYIHDFDITTLTHITLYTLVYWFVLLYTGVYSCILVYTLVYWCILVYTLVYWCILVYTLVHSCFFCTLQVMMR